MSGHRKTSKKQKKLFFPDKAWPIWIEPTILAIITIGALLLRSIGQLGVIFVQGHVMFKGVDSWYHMRLVDYTVNNFPHILKFDFFAQYPNGAEVGYLPLLTWIISSFGQIFNYEVVGAWVPPILGALVCIPVYYLGKEIHSGRVGLLAALLVAVLPGELFYRSLLGFTDHHVLEALLSVTCILFFIKLFKTGKGKWVVLSALALTAYDLAWAGTSFFLMIIGLWLVVETIRQKNNLENFSGVSLKVSLAVGIASILSFMYLSTPSIYAHSGVIAFTLILGIVCRLNSRKYQLIGLGVLGAIGIAVFIKFQDMIMTMLHTIFGSGVTYIMEAAPPTFTVIFSIYGMSFFLMFLGVIFYAWNKKKETVLFLSWAIILIIAALCQRRWAYYAIIPISLLSAYFSFYILKWLAPVLRVAVIIIVILFLILPGVSSTARLTTVGNNIDGHWYNTLVTLEDNSPEIEGYLTGREEKAEYGILSWWDYGHWVIRVAHRVPLTSPTQTSDVPSRFYTSTSYEEAEEVIGKLNIKYIIIDQSLLEGKWYAVMFRAAREVDIKQSMLYKLWMEQVPEYTKVFESGYIKVYERNIDV